MSTKKITKLFLALLLVGLVSGCGSTKNSQPQSTNQVINQSQLSNNGFISLTKDNKLPNAFVNQVYTKLLENKSTKDLKYLSDGNSYLIGCNNDGQIIIALNVIANDLKLEGENITGQGFISMFYAGDEIPQYGLIEYTQETGVKGNSFFISQELDEENENYQFVGIANGKKSDLDLTKQDFKVAVPIINPELNKFLDTYLSKIYQVQSTDEEVEEENTNTSDEEQEKGGDSHEH